MPNPDNVFKSEYGTSKETAIHDNEKDNEEIEGIDDLSLDEDDD